ncbi:MAG TPA: AraC family transcriptional regulator, partial [Candidatus Sulfotelmatobacter sp.]|nr:AraC family transcriptional regulator [Candidatus Sulfotelmatobacter sp.]
MSNSALRKRNQGCYSNPFSGVGMEFFPLGLLPDQSGLLLHETGYLACNRWWNFPNTLSPFWRLYFNARPGHKVVFPAAEFSLEPGHLVLIPDGQLFHSVGGVPVPHTWMTFQVARRLAPQQAIPIVLSPTQTERQLLRELARQFSGIGAGNRERVLHVSLALLHLVISRPEIQWQADAPCEGLQRAIRHMESHFHEPLKLQELARMAALSTRGFSKAFKRHQGLTPGRYLTQVRVRQTAELLARTEESLELVAEKVGFPNRYYLSRVFKRLTGDSPAHFRHKHA